MATKTDSRPSSPPARTAFQSWQPSLLTNPDSGEASAAGMAALYRWHSPAPVLRCDLRWEVPASPSRHPGRPHTHLKNLSTRSRPQAL